MGTVYLAHDPQLGRDVAVKLIQADLDYPDASERFVREARSIAALNHPNIVNVYDSGQFEARPYFVLELISGRTLATLIRSREPVPMTTRLRWLEALCEGLQFAHQRGIIHRDIKPANLMIDHLDRLRILDFGIARITGAEGTQASALVGTPSYMAPEYIRGEAIDTRVDIFAAGAVAYELFTFQRAFPGTTHATIMHNVMHEPPAPMLPLTGLNDPELEEVVLRALAKNPDERWQSAAELKAAFHKVCERLEGAEDLALVDAAVGGTIVREPTRNPRGLSYQSGPQGTVREEPPTPSLRGEALALWFSRWRSHVVILGGAIGVLGVAIFVTLSLTGTPDSTGTGPAPTSAGSIAESSGAGRGAAPPPVLADSAISVERGVGDSRRGAGDSKRDSVDSKRVGESTGSGSTGSTLSDVGSVGAPVNASHLFYGASTGGTVHVGLEYRILQRSPNGEELEVDPKKATFHTGDGVRFSFKSNSNGYLYVVQEGSSGRWNVLFPDPRINDGMNRVEKLKDYRIPSDEWFTFNDQPGTERLFVIFSREPLAQLPGLQRPVTQTQTLAQADVDELAATVRTRDLIFERTSAAVESKSSPEGNYVVNREELGTAVTATFELAHK